MVNKSALITGSAKRIGREIALSLAKKNIDIALHYNESESEALKLKAQIQDLGVRAEIFKGDLNQDCYEHLIASVVKEFPDLNILINNASIFEQTSILETTKDQLDRHFNINFQAPFFLTQSFVKMQKKGVVINFLDSRIKKTSKKYFSYLLTKKALADFTSMAAIELGPNVRVNGVAPGITPFSLDIDNDSYLKKIVDLLPLRKIAQTEDITKAVEILIDNDSLTGQTLFIDSGESL
jgi:pteridine reductase